MPSAARLLLLYLFAASVMANPSQMTAARGAAGESASFPDLIERILLEPAHAALRADFKAPTTLMSFYRARNFQPLWHDARGQPIAATRDLMAGLGEVAHDGLLPSDYHQGQLVELIAAEGPSALHIAQRELLMSDAFVLLALHLRDGRVRMETFEPRLRIAEVAEDVLEMLDEAVRFNRVTQTLDGLRPPLEGYWALRNMLPLYFAVEARGGWERILPGPTLREGDSGPEIARLRRRLSAEPGLFVPATDPVSVFDLGLRAAVRQYQRRHGLAPDGIVGPATRASLGIPAHARIRQIEANLERWRWLPQQLGSRYVLVNIANYSLTAHLEHQVALTMKVVVGTPYRSTPVFNDEIRYFVLNPSWEVPKTILNEDIVPALRADPELLQRQHFQLLALREGEWYEVDAQQIDWTAVLAPQRAFPFRLRQKPGPSNPLGRIKFVFPNKYDVYLHDTPARGLFKHRVRDFSSGCIRVEKPLELALFLMGEASSMPLRTLQRHIAAGAEKIIKLPHSVPIYIQYWTVWNGRSDQIQFRDDIYGRDDALAEALSLRS